MTHLKCFSITTILLVLVIETIIDAAPNPDPLDELTLNINIKEPNVPDGSVSRPKPEQEPKPGPSQNFFQDKLCGMKKQREEDESGIFNGEDTQMNEYPWMAGLEVDSKPYPHCGGSLIASQWVLTAHHCLEDKGGKANEIVVTLGDHINNKKGESKIEKSFKVEDWFIYADDGWEEKKEGDIALLKLEKQVDLNVYTPVCLPKKGDTINKYIGKDAWVYGWGQLETGAYPEKLQDVKIQVIPNAECSKNYKKRNIIIKSSMICAGDRNPTQTKDSCKGDSGGTLSVADEEGIHTQIGIVSFGIGCGNPELVGVYTNMFYFNDWITKTMKDNSGERRRI